MMEQGAEDYEAVRRQDAPRPIVSQLMASMGINRS